MQRRISYSIHRITDLLILALTLIAVSSCYLSQEEIRKKARCNETVGLLGGLFEYYVQCNYKMPSNIDDIRDFTAKLIENDPDDYLYDLKRHLDKDRLLSAFYTDSCFIYYPRLHAGSCIIGTPYYWIDHYMEHDPYKNYWLHFKSSGFDVEGHYDWSLHKSGADIYEDIDEEIQRIYESLDSNKVYHYQYILGSELLVPVMEIAEYDVRKDSIRIICRHPLGDTLYTKDSDGNAYPVEASDVPASDSYLRAIAEYVKNVTKDSKSVTRLLLPIKLSY